MTALERINHITQWLSDYAGSAGIQNFIVGISGGIDSSVVSALCARTGINTIVVQLPIRQNPKLDNLSSVQATWLLDRFPKSVRHISLDLTSVFAEFENKLGPVCATEQEPNPQEQLAFANSRSRLRMMTLYQIAQSHNGLVVGTGNRVEDFGVGFFTKYGDGGVDLSPIGDCLKTEVWDMGRELGLSNDIIDAPPTDGLWDDDRTDENQLGMSYPDLERMMYLDETSSDPTDTDQEKFKRYQTIRQRNLHKMQPIPVCKF